jgi:hypothetical protein
MRSLGFHLVLTWLVFIECSDSVISDSSFLNLISCSSLFISFIISIGEIETIISPFRILRITCVGFKIITGILYSSCLTVTISAIVFFTAEFT